MKKIILFLLLIISAPSFSQTIFEETFENNSNRWNQEGGSSNSSTIENGEYILKTQGLGLLGKLISGIEITALDPGRDFSIQCNATCLDGDNFSGFGIAYDIEDNNNYSEFIITQKGSYGNFKVEGSWKKSLNNKYLISSDLVKPRTKNTLEIKRVGLELQFYLNQSLINTLSYTYFYHKKIGFVAYGREKVSFDNLIIQQSSTGGKVTYKEPIAPAPPTPVAKEENKVVVKKETRPSHETRSLNNADSEKAHHITQSLKERYNYGLFIAVQDYQDNAINDLDNPIQDSKNLMKVLTSKYTFAADKQMVLQNPTRGELIHQLDKLAKIVTPQDNLFIFYAGHGVWDEQLKKGYWLPSNARKDNRTEWFSNSDLRDYIGGINSKHTLLVADACFSGGIFKTRDAFANNNHTAVVELFKLPSRQAMTSGAMKSVPDKSVFIQYLLKRLNENEDQFLSAEQLFSSFKVAVINNSPNSQVPQFGEIKETGDEGGDFIFIKK